MPSKRVVLLGDSIIDNKSYVAPGEPSVSEQLRARLPDCHVEMRAVDGSTTVDVLNRQTSSLARADVLVLSTGGNDALKHIELLDGGKATTSRDVLVQMQKLRSEFHRVYASLHAKLSGLNAQLIALTIYNPKFSAHGMEVADELAAEAALSVFNDVIQQVAAEHGAEVLDIRPLFTEGDDFANPIEPSAKGGDKLAAAISGAIAPTAP